MWKPIVSGETTDLPNLMDFEDALAEGQRGKLHFLLRMDVPDYVISELKAKLLEAGVIDAEVKANGKEVDIIFRKGMPWLAIIVGIVLGLIILAVLIMSWQFYKEVPEEIQKPLLIIGIVAVIALIAVVAYVIARGRLPTGGA